jgi:hypothetical protein
VAESVIPNKYRQHGTTGVKKGDTDLYTPNCIARSELLKNKTNYQIYECNRVLYGYKNGEARFGTNDETNAG